MCLREKQSESEEENKESESEREIKKASVSGGQRAWEINKKVRTAVRVREKTKVSVIEEQTDKECECER